MTSGPMYDQGGSMGRVGYILLGFVVSAFGAVLAFSGMASSDVLGGTGAISLIVLGYVVAGIGWLMILIGVIAAGVFVGMRDHAERERRLYARADAYRSPAQ